MELTYIGVVAAIVGLMLMRASATAMLAFLVFCSVMGAAAAINLPALGGPSIPPAHFALAFIFLRLMMSPLDKTSAVIWSVKTNGFLAVFVIYGAIGAFVFPRMFEGQISLTPMKVTAEAAKAIFGVTPLAPSTQNITQAFYLIGTLVCAMGASIVARVERNGDQVVSAILTVCWIHLGCGLLDLVFYAAGMPTALDWLRNGNYQQLSQRAGAFHRISGIFPEPSGFATYGFMLLVFTTELWLRNIRPVASGVTAGALAFILVLSTSSTAYVSIGVYVLILCARLFVFTPSGRGVGKGFILVSGMMAAATGFVVIALLYPEFAQSLIDVFQDMTTEKAQTMSAVQRAFWARQGLEAFQATGGLGVGAGSFRSSSLATSIIGSTGVIGTAGFVFYCLTVLKPLRPATHSLTVDPLRGIGAAAGWAAAFGIFPGLIASAGPDPGFLFAIFSGLALAWARANDLPVAAEPSPVIFRPPPSWAPVQPMRLGPPPERLEHSPQDQRF